LAKNQTVHFNGNRLSVPLPANRRKIKEVLDKEKFDILHVMVPYSPFLAQRIIMAADKSTVVVGTFHIFPSGWLSKAGSRLLRIAYWRSQRRFLRIVSVSGPAADFAKTSYGMKSDVVPNPVEIKRFKHRHQPGIGKERQVVFLGRLVKRKGCRQLIEAFYLIRQAHPNVKLVIAGGGPERQALETLVRQKGISDSVTFLGYVKEEDKPQLLGDADIACFPSLYGEAFGIVLIEAMASGSGPVLAGDNPGYRSVLGDRPDSLVDPNDKQAFASRLSQLLDDPKLSQELRRWQKRTVGQYDVAVVGARIEDMYRTAIAQKIKKSHNRHHE
jgi:phosphatidylinositol alpha-mannosyltransferase